MDPLRDLTNSLNTFSKFYQDKQNELVILEQKIRQAKDELAARQAAVILASPDIPRDIRTEIFSHITNNQYKSETYFLLVGTTKESKEFSVVLYTLYQTFDFDIELAKYTDVESLQHAIRDIIVELSTDCHSVYIFNKIVSTWYDKTYISLTNIDHAGSVLLPIGPSLWIKAFTEVLSCLSGTVVSQNNAKLKQITDEKFKRYFIRIQI